MALEQPQYSVEKIVDGVEYRIYDSYFVAQCDLREISDLNVASNAGFRQLFNYISGENAESQKVSMTVPVQQIPTDTGWLVSFVVPKSFYKTGAPKPRNAGVKIVEVPGGLVAAIKYRGLWNSDAYKNQSALLLRKLTEQGATTSGPVFSAVYNPPLTPPFLRRNEVLVSLKDS